MSEEKPKKAIIIGAGPAGLTAAYTLLCETDIIPVIYEESGDIGGISKTVNHNGNRIDIGGHRFFTKNEDAKKMWFTLLGEQSAPSKDDLMLNRTRVFDGTDADPEQSDRVMLKRHRVSRIFYLRKFFDYPISLKAQTFINMGLLRTLKAGFGYVASVLHKRKENSLEDFYINRFGRPLYEMFFEDYTEKLWGVHPSHIAPDWGAQRVKGLSVMKLLLNVLTKPFNKKTGKVETSLIEEFFYPKFGPGHYWQTVAEEIEKRGGTIVRNAKVTALELKDGAIASVTVTNTATDSDADSNKAAIESASASNAAAASRNIAASTIGSDETTTGVAAASRNIVASASNTESTTTAPVSQKVSGDYYISSMPIKDLIDTMSGAVPSDVAKIAHELPYRDFITVGLLLNKLNLKNMTPIKTVNNIVPDCWIYMQERDLKIGRLQIFNNWSPYMVSDFEHKVWIGLEYFCQENDSFWTMSDADFINFAIDELAKIDVIDKKDVVDSVRIKVKKAYPAYFGSYAQFDKVQNFLNTIDNLYCVGRNGQHRYNNMDHSMVTAMEAVNAIKTGTTDKSAIWRVNTEEEYHETKNTDAK